MQIILHLHNCTCSTLQFLKNVLYKTMKMKYIYIFSWMENEKCFDSTNVRFDSSFCWFSSDSLEYIHSVILLKLSLSPVFTFCSRRSRRPTCLFFFFVWLPSIVSSICADLSMTPDTNRGISYLLVLYFILNQQSNFTCWKSWTWFSWNVRYQNQKVK